MKTYSAPSLPLPITGEDRKALLRRVNATLLRRIESGFGASSDPKCVALQECAIYCAKVWVPFFVKALGEVQNVFATTAWDDMENFRSLWISEVVSRIFNHTPGVPPHFAVECVFDYEVDDRKVGQTAKQRPWEDHKHFSEYMAVRLCMAPVQERTLAQKLAYFGFVATDFQGIDLPGYDPPEPRSFEEVKRNIEPISSEPNVSKSEKLYTSVERINPTPLITQAPRSATLESLFTLGLLA